MRATPLGIRLFTRPAAVAPGGGAFTPASLTGLAAWYDADQQTETADSAVTTFVDRSTNGNNFAQSSIPGARPLLRYAAINGKKAMDFDGIDDYFANTGLLNGATAGAWFAVVKLDADPPVAGSAGAVLNEFNALFSDNHHPFTDGTIYDGFGSTVRKTVGNPTPALTSVSLLGVISAPGDYRFFVNDLTTPFFTTATNTVGFGTVTRFMGYSDNAAQFFAGLMAEVIVMSSVPTSTDLANIKAYFNTKFGTSFA